MSRILLLEDNAITHKVIRTFLEAEGYHITHFSNGKEGIESLQKEHYDLVLTDIYMPVQNGLDTIKIIRSNNSDIKILAMSAGIESGNADYLREASKLGATATLTKPINRKKLVELVHALIHNKESELLSVPSVELPPKMKKIFYVDEQKTILKSISSHFNNVSELKNYALITSNSTDNLVSTLKFRSPDLLIIQYELLTKLTEAVLSEIQDFNIPIIVTVHELPDKINLPKSFPVTKWSTRILESDELEKLIKSNLV